MVFLVCGLPPAIPIRRIVDIRRPVVTYEMIIVDYCCHRAERKPALPPRIWPAPDCPHSPDDARKRGMLDPFRASWVLLGSLVIGSLPGIFFGSHLSARVPDKVLRPVLATILVIVGVRMLLRA